MRPQVAAAGLSWGCRGARPPSHLAVAGRASITAIAFATATADPPAQKAGTARITQLCRLGVAFLPHRIVQSVQQPAHHVAGVQRLHLRLERGSARIVFLTRRLLHLGEQVAGLLRQLVLALHVAVPVLPGAGLGGAGASRSGQCNRRRRLLLRAAPLLQVRCLLLLHLHLLLLLLLLPPPLSDTTAGAPSTLGCQRRLMSAGLGLVAASTFATAAVACTSATKCGPLLARRQAAAALWRGLCPAEDAPRMLGISSNAASAAPGAADSQQ